MIALIIIIRVTLFFFLLLLAFFLLLFPLNSCLHRPCLQLPLLLFLPHLLLRVLQVAAGTVDGATSVARSGLIALMLRLGVIIHE